MASTESTALIVALIALIISLLQVVQQYTSSAVSRAKVNRAAIGMMSQRNRYTWSFREWRLKVHYALITITLEEVLEAASARDLLQARIAASVLNPKEYTFSQSLVVSNGSQWNKPPSLPKLVVYRKGDESNAPVPLSNFSWRQRRVLKRLERDAVRQHVGETSCKASWLNMMAELRVDITAFREVRFMDADTIPTSLDAPTTLMKMSDVVSFGFLLDMRLTSYNTDKLTITMSGRVCNLITQDHPGAGPITRYSGIAMHMNNRPSILKCNSTELKMLTWLASGKLMIGDTFLKMSDLGHNTIDLIFSTALTKAKDSGWEKINISDEIEGMHADTDIHWNGKWSDSMVPIPLYVLAICGNPAVANAYPRGNMLWDRSYVRVRASEAAFNLLERGIQFVVAPTSLFRTIQDKKIDLVVMDTFKTANNWGSESGGVRGWLVGNLSEFTFRMSRCWSAGITEERVPILPHLLSSLKDGTLDAKWGKNYNSAVGSYDQGSTWKMNANSLFWIQIMMFDTWIARRVEMIMGERLPNADLSVPADEASARMCASLPVNKSDTTGWKRSRSTFMIYYNQRVAESFDGRGSSCMSGQMYEQGWAGISNGWAGMPKGKAEDWAAVDAVLTLRAVVMAARLELMNDSTVLLELQEFDPVIQIA